MHWLSVYWSSICSLNNEHILNSLCICRHTETVQHIARPSMPTGGNRATGFGNSGHSYGFISQLQPRRYVHGCAGWVDRRHRAVTVSLAELAEQSLMFTEVGRITGGILARLVASVQLPVASVLCSDVGLEVRFPCRSVTAQWADKPSLLMGHHVILQVHWTQTIQIIHRWNSSQTKHYCRVSYCFSPTISSTLSKTAACFPRSF